MVRFIYLCTSTNFWFRRLHNVRLQFCASNSMFGSIISLPLLFTRFWTHIFMFLNTICCESPTAIIAFSQVISRYCRRWSFGMLLFGWWPASSWGTLACILAWLESKRKHFLFDFDEKISFKIVDFKNNTNAYKNMMKSENNLVCYENIF